MIRVTEQAVRPANRRKRYPSGGKRPGTMGRMAESLRTFSWLAKPIGVALILILLVAATRPVLSTSVFELKEVLVKGNTLISSDQAEALVRQVMGDNVYSGDLDEVRTVFKHLPLVKDVVVARLLPDMVRIDLIERKPLAVVRLSSDLVCVDDEGVTIGDFSLIGAQPTLIGWDERHSAVGRTANLTRLRLYCQLRDALSSMGRDYWNEVVNEVDISNPNDVVITLKQSPTTEIHLGDREFGRRFRSLLNILDDTLQGRLRVSYINVSDPSRVVVRSPQPHENTQTIVDSDKEKKG